MPMKVLSLIYIFAVTFNWVYNHIAYNEDGIFDMADARSMDVFLTLMPIVNVFAVVFYADHGWPMNKYDPYNRKMEFRKKKSFANSFFEVKRTIYKNHN